MEESAAMATRACPWPSARTRGGWVHKVKIEVEISDRLYHAYEQEAERTGDTVEHLVEGTVDALIREMERESDDHPIWI